jgi:hypothetical protein
MHAGPRKPAVSVVLFQGRLPEKEDKLRRKLQDKLDLSASDLLKRALAALDRELNAAGEAAE